MNRLLLSINEVLRSSLPSFLRGQLGIDKNRDYNKECGYLDTLTRKDYQDLHEREGLATRVNSIFPDESWIEDPEIIQNEDPEKTPWEEAVSSLVEEKNIWHYLHRVDTLSGIGRFGAMLIGVDDGEADLKNPVQPGEGRKLLYLRCFSEANIQVVKTVTDVTSPHYGYPELYKFTYSNYESENSNTVREIVAHHSRVLHVTDNREEDDIYGVPRMRDVFNRLIDLRKILSSSPEMFWKGGFPGLAFKTDQPLDDNTELDKESVVKALEDYQEGLKRYIGATGMTVQSLAVQVADPTNHFMTQLKAIALSKGIPWRIFAGSEEAKLASEQDKDTWEKRINMRRTKYLAPMLIRPFFQRLMDMGILDTVEEWKVKYSVLGKQTEEQKANIAQKQTQAMGTYVGSNVETIMPVSSFLTHIMQLDHETVQAIEKDIEERDALLDEEDDLENDLEGDETQNPDQDPEEEEKGQEGQTIKVKIDAKAEPDKKRSN